MIDLKDHLLTERFTSCGSYLVTVKQQVAGSKDEIVIGSTYPLSLKKYNFSDVYFKIKAEFDHLGIPEESWFIHSVTFQKTSEFLSDPLKKPTSK